MANLDAPILPPLTSTTGAENLVTVRGNTERNLKVNGVLGLLSGDVTTVSGTTATVSTRVTVCTSTSAVTLTLPPVGGDLREVIVIKASATSAVAVNSATPAQVVTGTSVAANGISILAGKASRLLSDGTKWYHVAGVE
jgi:hypothetical protein